MPSEIPSYGNGEILRKRTQNVLFRGLLSQAVGIGLAAGGARYYYTHPWRVTAGLPADLAEQSQEVFLTAEDGARLHAIWLDGQSRYDSPLTRNVLRRGRPVCRPRAAIFLSRSGRDGSPIGPLLDGDLCARTIIQCHGYNSSGGLLLARSPEPLTAWPLVRAALARGYNFLLVDMRAHGQSTGPWDTTGTLVANDLVGWVRWLRETHDQLWVGLWGNSLGSSVGLGVAARSACGGLDAMVLDSPVVSAVGLYSGLIRKPAYWLVQPVLRLLAGDGLLETLRSTDLSLPVLLVHGMADAHVPAWHSERAYELIWRAQDPERSALWLVPGADHLESLEVVPEMYIRRTLGWFDRWFG